MGAGTEATEVASCWETAPAATAENRELLAETVCLAWGCPGSWRRLSELYRRNKKAFAEDWRRYVLESKWEVRS